MSKKDSSQNSTGLIGWIDERFPLSSFIKNHLTGYYAPKNFNFWYLFGALALFVFVMQPSLQGNLLHELGSDIAAGKCNLLLRQTCYVQQSTKCCFLY
jgi:hypothetical protein